MQHIIVSDIFGVTDALLMLADQLPGDWVILDPYDGIKQIFQNETQAYSHFQKISGVEMYARRLSDSLAQVESPVNVIGFSVGAAALWQVLSSSVAEKVDQAIGFYGNQIRHSVGSEPCRPVTLVLPEHEKHFSVVALAETLDLYPQVKLQQSAYLHGFMNPASVNYSASGYTEYLYWLKQLFADG